MRGLNLDNIVFAVVLSISAWGMPIARADSSVFARVFPYSKADPSMIKVTAIGQGLLRFRVCDKTNEDSCSPRRLGRADQDRASIQGALRTLKFQVRDLS